MAERLKGMAAGVWARVWTVAVPAQSTVEYALVGALVVIASAAALTLLGGELSSVFNQLTNTLKGSATAH
jgi:Flp pilus assembly pilin Flp